MFDIPVKIEGLDKRRRSVGLFHILAGLFLLANASLAFKYLDYSDFWPLLPVYIVAIISLIYGFLRKKIDAPNKYSWSLRLIQFLTFLGLAVFELRSESSIHSISLFLWAGICLSLLFTERFIFNQPSVKIGNDGIRTPGSIASKIFAWSDLDSVAVRQDYITLMFGNNKYLQFEILEMLTGTEIERINLFCREQLDKAEDQKVKILEK
ncbi:hypothetical protein OCK74_23645 [Chitinophagaceae bacterium LB-8]|uniref:Uncharacterized protein n=1 Tax=Paraflavisolibacter caeni TaxID=2982496 RepID=A0A9X2XPT3_9BACT|nr:hypothetical protein [Paraflavisolibacter caeni]MCU7552133.1 hypothetical protein [Paraflavisolibacter caeni]